MKKNLVVLIDRKNRKIGFGEKIKVHREGKLHRAFSVFIFNSQEKLLLQQRAKRKYHSPLLWSNTVDGHPLPGETFLQAAKRRLKEEMGFICRLKKLTCFFYKAKVNDLIENEYDCLFWGIFDGKPKPNFREVKNYKWLSLKELKREIKKEPNKYTIWLRIALKKVKLPFE